MSALPAGVQVWVRSVHDVAADPNLLDAAELAQWAAFTSAVAADSYLAGHCLLRQALAATFGMAAGAWTFSRACRDCARPHGRPLVTSRADTWVSLSRTTSHVAVAVGTRAPVGIDIERRDRFDDPAQATTWTRKEAALKAIGLGLRIDPHVVPTPVPGVFAPVAPGYPPVRVVDLALADGSLAGSLGVLSAGAAAAPG